MKTELAVIATEFLKDCVTKAMQELTEDIEYTLYFYSNFSEVLDIYRRIPRGCAA